MRKVLLLSLALLLPACSRQVPPPAAPAAAQQEAVVRTGDVTIRATAMPTTGLGAEIADRYGIVRDDDTIMLLVGIRKDTEAQEVALPATIQATATNLSGQRQAIALRELRSDDLLDYVGTVKADLPDTLRFDLVVVPEGASSTTLQFSREFYPR